MTLMLILIVTLFLVGLFISPTYRFYKGPTTNKVEEFNPLRLFFAKKYLVLGIIGLILYGVIYFVFQPKVLSCKPGMTEYLIGLLWCFSWTSIGFAAIAFHWSCLQDSPLPDYITHYPLQLIAIANLVLIILCRYNLTETYIFYPLSFSICFTLGFYVDSISSFLKKP